MSYLIAAQLAVREIERYGDEMIAALEALTEEQLWSKKGGIPNSIGTLARHLTGNLNHYFGAGILGNGYVRDRDREFSETELPLKKVVSDLMAAVAVAKESLQAIGEERAGQPHRAPCGEEYESLAHHVVRLATHFARHRGQMQFAERCVAEWSAQ
ncbi:MAG: DinB family protein [Anaerolineales bacterium]|nr:MAG: DinB family protein [Anaerolineales bacterium]